MFISQAGPFYKNRHKVGDIIWDEEGSYSIESFNTINYKDYALLKCIYSPDKTREGRVCYRSIKDIMKKCQRF